MKKSIFALFFGCLVHTQSMATLSSLPFSVDPQAGGPYQLFVVHGDNWNTALKNIHAIGAEAFVPWDKQSLALSAALLSAYQKNYFLNIVKANASSPFLDGNSQRAYALWPHDFAPDSLSWGPLAISIEVKTGEWFVDSPVTSKVEILAKAPPTLKFPALKLDIPNIEFVPAPGSPVCNGNYPTDGKTICDDMKIKRVHSTVENTLTITPTYPASPSRDPYQQAFFKTCKFYIDLNKNSDPVIQVTQRTQNNFCHLKITERYIQILFNVYETRSNKKIFGYHNHIGIPVR